MLMYQSTRDCQIKESATHAILQGISKEGGLFVPQAIPQIDFDLGCVLTDDYQTLAYRVMLLFFEVWKEEDLKRCS